MNDVASGQSVWSLQGTRGELRCGYFSGEVDVARPQLGLRSTPFDSGGVPCTFLGAYRGAKVHSLEAAKTSSDDLQWPLPVAEAYVRGNDLVTNYRAIDEWPYSPQLYWQANTLDAVDGVVGSVSLLVSVQTHLLDTHPQISVASQLQSVEWRRISISENWDVDVLPVKQREQLLPEGLMCCVIRRLSVKPFSYVEIMPTTDFCEVSLHPEGNGIPSTHWHLFADFLEKGVIRRARVHAVLVPQENDIELAVECCRILAQSPLPLTT